MVTQVSEPGERERWYGFLGALRNAGFGLGGLLSGAVLATAAYRGVVAVNASSFLLAALLLLLDQSHTGPPATVRHDADDTSPAGGQAVLADRPYLALTAVNVAFATNSFALTIVLPVYAVVRLGLPPLAPGGRPHAELPVDRPHARTRGQRPDRAGTRPRSAGVVRALGRVRPAHAAVSAVPRAAAAAIVLAAVVVFTLGELIESPVLATVASEAAPDALRGRYLALHQASWNVSNTIAPALLTCLLAAGTWPVCLALGALAAAAALGISAVATRLPAARQLIGLAPNVTPCPAAPQGR